jgi:hypothetical protein
MRKLCVFSPFISFFSVIFPKNVLDIRNPPVYHIGRFRGQTGAFCMKGNRDIIFALLLALSAFALSLSPVTMPVLSAVFDIHAGNHTSLAAFLSLLLILGWAPGFAFAVIAERLLQHIHGPASGLNFTHAISLLAIIISFCWILVLITAPLIHYLVFGK